MQKGKMRFIEVETKNRTADFINRLLTVWESSVRATHLFLSDSEIKKIKEYVPQALAGIAHLMIAEDDRGCPGAFMGIKDGTLEMLFISPEERGKGLGKRLLQKETLVKGIKTKDRKSYNAVVKIGEKGYIDFISFSK